MDDEVVDRHIALFPKRSRSRAGSILLEQALDGVTRERLDAFVAEEKVKASASRDKVACKEWKRYDVTAADL